MTLDPTLQPSIAQARNFSGDRVTRPVVADSDDGDVVLVLANEPLRKMLGEVVRAHGYDVQASATPLETVQLLERLKDRLRCAIISSQLPWGPSVCELLIDEYPDIEPVVVDA
ncbi:MAG TPA: hypothetical protein VFK02_24035 [Kofleriaceae bacterium]|nr:hypothetical protein [Kofleriaceae bacterium]